jgi:predicted nucleic acid-binding protein
LILADTSLWIDRFRRGHAELRGWLEAGDVLIHPFVIGELAMGNLSAREAVLNGLDRLPASVVATHDEILALVSAQKLSGLGLGYVDAALLASVRLTPDARLRTADRRLQSVADRLDANI